ncbi:hypothetical protein D081_0569 [Anaerovibrio sp. JC8]|nr:hypothetical protein D081_0569 [Anaerovibrio sp. JC8]
MLADVYRVQELLDLKMPEYDDIVLDYRIKSIQSINLKYERYYPDHQAAKVFNDIVGFRTLCDNYDDILVLQSMRHFKIVDLSQGKSKDDGYRGVHVYFQLSNHHYPVEIQYNTYYDRQINNWLHKYTYKKGYPDSLCCELREKYEQGIIKNEVQFKEVLDNVLSDSKRF